MTRDKVVEKVVALFRSRSAVGIKKYNTTLDKNLKINFIDYAIEEQMDQLNYLVAFKHQMDQLCKENPNDADLGKVIRELYQDNTN